MIINQYTGRILKHNAACQIPRYVVAVDTETIPHAISGESKVWLHQFRLGVAIATRIDGTKPTRTKIFRFTNTDDFWHWLYGFTSRSYTVWLVAHNMLFDLRPLGMPREFTEARLVLDSPRSKRKNEHNDPDNSHCYGLAVLSSPPTILGMRCVATQGRLIAIDTLNYFATDLRSLGVAAGIEKLQMPEFDQPDEDWFIYCQRDCEIVFNTIVALIGFVRENNLGNFRYTAAGQAMAAFRHRFYLTKIYYHDNTEVKVLERDAFVGGRTEVFRMGAIEDDVWYLDINSLFPSVMRDSFYPCKLVRYEFRKEPSPTMPDIDWGRSIATVELNTDEAIYPKRVDSGILYPLGVFTTTLCGRELVHAHHRGHVRAVASWAEYDTASLFASFVNGLYALRCKYRTDGNKMYEQLVKSILNALYGKFGERTPHWEPMPGAIAAEPWCQWTEIYPATGEREIYRTVGYHVFKQCERGEKQYSLPAISAFITSAARMRMNSLRCIAGHRNCFYQGIDGLIVNKAGYNALSNAGELHPTELGKLKTVLTTNEGEIYGCADYRMGTKTVVAGRYNLAK